MPAGPVAHPKTAEEAVHILAGHGPDAMVIAGGTDVVPNLQMKLFSPGLLVDIKRIASLRGMHVNAAGELRIGALTTLTEVENSPLIRHKYSVVGQAVAAVAGPLQRNMGTIGGNLCLETRCRWYNQSYFWRKSLGGCLKKDGPICHVAPGGQRCWAAWSGDSAPAFLTLGAELEIAGPQGIHRMPLQSFYRNDGIDRIALARDELVTAILVPPGSAGRQGAYHKLRIRNSIDYPVAGVAIALELDANGICRDARIAITAVNPAPLLLSQAGEWLVGKKYSRELAERVAHAAIQTAKPLTTSASTPVYRRDMLRLFTRRTLEQVWNAQTNSQLNPLAD
jgi:4-hydroxybenzoyl-CoA reductase subunit beta